MNEILKAEDLLKSIANMPTKSIKALQELLMRELKSRK